MKIFILSCENINQRSINQLHKKICSLFSNFWPNFGKTLAKQVECDITRFACKLKNYQMNYNSFIACYNQMKFYRQNVRWKVQQNI